MFNYFGCFAHLFSMQGFKGNIANSNFDWLIAELKPEFWKCSNFVHLVKIDTSSNTQFQVSTAVISYLGRLLIGRPSSYIRLISG